MLQASPPSPPPACPPDPCRPHTHPACPPAPLLAPPPPPAPLPPCRPQRVLDFGAGMGTASWAAQEVGQVTAQGTGPGVGLRVCRSHLARGRAQGLQVTLGQG